MSKFELQDRLPIYINDKVHVITTSPEDFVIQSGVTLYDEIQTSKLLIAERGEEVGTEDSPWYEFKYGWFLRLVVDKFLVGKYMDDDFYVCYLG